MPVDKLSEAQVESQLMSHPEWSEAGGALQRTYQFRNFAEAMAFVNKVAAAAERSNHHPDILVRYNKVTLTLSTHDAGGITLKDFELAGVVDACAPCTGTPGTRP
ncbi:MAG TPA: 4a-hydroxytetrahydrobiopterin dehydratase [Phycisphaerales bacterium]|nr:4a-hydroxytetrahydrobiopterin dehydratase [Phycisphaerales bacterium]